MSNRAVHCLLTAYEPCPVWSESSLSAWRNLGSLATHWSQAKTDQTGRMPRLIWVYAGRTLILLFCHVVVQMVLGDAEIRPFAGAVAEKLRIQSIRGILKLQKDTDQLGCWTRKRGIRFLPVASVAILCNYCYNKMDKTDLLEGKVFENVVCILGLLSPTT